MDKEKLKLLFSKENLKYLFGKTWFKCALFVLLGLIIGRLSVVGELFNLNSQLTTSINQIKSIETENENLTNDNKKLESEYNELNIKVTNAKPFFDLSNDEQEKVRQKVEEEKKKADEAKKKLEDENVEAKKKEASKETITTYSDIDVSNNPAGQAAKTFFSGWQEKDYDKMVAASEKSFIDRQNNPEELLEAQYGFKDLKEFHIVKVYEKAPAATEITVNVVYTFANGEQRKTIIANVIKENDWGVNPISTLREN